MKKKVWIIFAFVIVMGSVAAFNINFDLVGRAVSLTDTCSDGTPYGQCSKNKEFYCSNGEIISDCGLCGCGDGYACIDNQCQQSQTCQEGNGFCSNQCDSGYAEFTPLTGTCNLEENNNGNIDISNSKEIIVDSFLKNNNPYRILENIHVNVFIEGTEIKGGYTLLILNPNEEYSQRLHLIISDYLDKTKAYKLRTQVSYRDKTLSQDYSISATDQGFSFVLQNVTFSENQQINLGDNLMVNFEIINRKCCISNINKVDRFFGYCSNEGQCSDKKPLTCQEGILIEDCTKCDCSENYTCSSDKKCIYKVSSEELNKFYSQNNINTNEQAIIGDFIKDFSRIPMSTAKPELSISDNNITVRIEDVKLVGGLVNKTPQINIDLGK